MSYIIQSQQRGDVFNSIFCFCPAVAAISGHLIYAIVYLLCVAIGAHLAGYLIVGYLHFCENMEEAPRIKFYDLNFHDAMLIFSIMDDVI